MVRAILKLVTGLAYHLVDMSLAKKQYISENNGSPMSSSFSRSSKEKRRTDRIEKDILGTTLCFQLL